MANLGPMYHSEATANAAQTVAAHREHREIILWAGWFCPFSQRVWIALEEKKVAYQYNEVNPYRKEPSFLAINPKGLVPALGLGGRSISDSYIICEYLEDAFPNLSPHLLPTDPFEKAVARTWIDFINKSVVPAFFRLLQVQPSEPDKLRQAVAELSEALGTLSQNRRGAYFFGDSISLVDIFVAPWAVRDFVLRDYRSFQRQNVRDGWKEWAELLEVHPSVVKTTSESQYYVEFNRTFLENELHSAAGNAARTGQAIP